MCRISAIEPGAAPGSPWSSGPHMWPILSMAPRLTIMPRQFGSFLISRMAASADQVSPPMCAGSKPGHEAVAVERIDVRRRDDVRAVGAADVSWLVHHRLLQSPVVTSKYGGRPWPGRCRSRAGATDGSGFATVPHVCRLPRIWRMMSSGSSVPSTAARVAARARGGALLRERREARALAELRVEVVLDLRIVAVRDQRLELGAAHAGGHVVGARARRARCPRRGRPRSSSPCASGTGRS